MSRTNRIGAALVLFIAAACLGAEKRVDSDGDGLSDAHEEILGTDPGQPDLLRVVLEDGVESDERRRERGYDATKDVTTVEFCHVGDDRYLWRVTLAAAPRLDDTVLHLYVDADANSATGRTGPAGAASTGTEYMLSVVGGQCSSGRYQASGDRLSGPLVTYVVDGDCVLISADADLGRDQRGVRYALYVLCHTLTASGKAPGMSDSCGKRLIAGEPLSDRRKRMRPCDYTANFGVDATFGIDLLRDTLEEKETLVVPHDQLEKQGFVVDLFTSRRWPHVRLEGAGGKVWTKVPSPGRRHVGFMMYDDSADERVGLYVDGRLCGIAVANQDNNQTWLYWLRQARDFRGGERIELRAMGPSGKHGICNILLLKQPPEIRAIRLEVQNMASATHVGKPGVVTLSWTTTWPCPTRFEYGRDAGYGRKVETAGNCLAHRVVLDGLDPGTAYHGRAIGAARDGSPFYGGDFVFRASPRPAPPTRPDTSSVRLTVSNPHSFPVENWPVTTGVPFPQGELGSPDHVRLVADGAETPAQVQLAGRWPDGSVKWLLATFQVAVPARGERAYDLQYGRQIGRRAGASQLVVDTKPDGVHIDTGSIRFRMDRHGNVADLTRGDRRLLAPKAVCCSVARDVNNRPFSTAEAKADLCVEEAGPLRAVVKAASQLANAQGERLMRIETRIEAYRGAAYLRMRHTFVVDRPEMFTDIADLSYRIPAAAANRAWRVPTANGRTIDLGLSQPSARQRFDDELVVVREGREAPSKDRILGPIIAGGEDGCAIAVRDFWRNYPKAFSVRADGLHVGLCPEFAKGLYDQFPFEKQGHQLYYYLLNGRYRLKRGVSKTHEIFLCFEPEPQRALLCELFQRPLLGQAAPQWCCGSKVFYDAAPRDTERFRLYEEAIDKNLAAYAAQRERQHDFGMLNYGDWYGERGTNWGNEEYDTQHALFLEYVRSGNPAAFFLGEAAELHHRDIDTLQWSEDPREIGAVYVHQMCHVGDYYEKPVPGSLGYPRGGYSVSHAWVEGHFDHYYLTGDRRSYEAGCAVADYFIRQELSRPYDFEGCRTPGWHLIMLAAAYAATNDPYYLNASRVIVEHVLQTQDKKPRPLPAYQSAGRKPYQLGGWSRMLVPGHCQCEPRHRGNAGFMVAILLSGLKYYHDVTGDPRVKEAIILGAGSLLDETYCDEVRGFRYTSCPNTPYRPGASPLMVEGVARAYLWTKEDRFRRVLTEALPIEAGGSGYGKGFSMYYRMAPRVLADLDAAGIRLDQAAGSRE